MSIAEESHKAKTSYMLPFEKMHGLGNDFVMINVSHLPGDTSEAYESELCKKLCDRHRGVGADGMIIIDQVKESENAIRSWRYYNGDGTVAEMCGNGIRCAAKYIYEHGLSGEETNFKIETLAGDIGIELLDDEMVRVDMGAPREIVENQNLIISTFNFPYTFVSMGNPHVISFWDCDLDHVKNYGPQIEVFESFKNGTNVEFARKLPDRHCEERSDVAISRFELIVWERGCGFTEACGTGACATAVAAIKKGLCKMDEDIEIQLPGGTLIIKWDSVTGSVMMTGKAELSYLGYFNN